MTDKILGAETAQCNATQNFQSGGVALRPPKNWAEAVARVETLDAEWDALDLDDEAESARVSDLHEETMLAFTRCPAPNAAGLIYKIRKLHEADRVQCDDDILAQICSEIADLLADDIHGLT